MRQLAGILIFIFAYFVCLSFVFRDRPYVNTRKSLFQNRALNRTSLSSIATKRLYFRESFNQETKKGDIALKMNKKEYQYKIPYVWGGDIRKFGLGLDCTGFLHGLMYYNGEIGFNQRFNSFSLYKFLKRNKHYQEIYDALHATQPLDYNILKVNDIILWPTGISDGKNLPGEILGHVGIVSTIKDSIPYVTHYVDSPKHNPYDIIGITGPGINTMRADSFIVFKEKGRLLIYREKS